MMMSEGSDYISKQNKTQMEKTRKVSLKIRDTSKQIIRNPTTGSDESNAAKKRRKYNSEKDKQTPSATAKMDTIWSNLQSEKEDDTINMRVYQSEDIWTKQGVASIFGLETPSIVILEQPDPNYRYRYGSEGNVVAPLHGEHACQKGKTYPKIQLINFDQKNYEKVEIFVSCVTLDPCPRVHPYAVKNNKRKKGANCMNGVCHVTLNDENGIVEFVVIGIQRVKKEETQKSLKDRENMGVDPFNQGYDLEHSQYEKEAVKLCFEAHLTDLHGNIIALPPVTSNTIANTKGKRMSLHSVTPERAISGNPEKITLLAENLPPAGDILVMFSTPEWSKTVVPVHEHHKYAVQVFTPKLDVKINQKTQVEVKLIRISNQAVTGSLKFFFFPPKNNRPSLPNKPTDTQTNKSKETGQEFNLPFRDQKLLEGELIKQKTKYHTMICQVSKKVNIDKVDTQELEEMQNLPEPQHSSTHNNDPLLNNCIVDNINLDPTFENLDEFWNDLNPDYMMPEPDEGEMDIIATTAQFFQFGTDMTD